MSKCRPHLPCLSKHHKGSETVRECIAHRKKLFREQLTINTKQDKIHELKTTVSNAKKQISEEEKALEQDALTFEEYLKKLEMIAVEAMKTANQATKARLEKEAEVRKVLANIMAIKSDIVKEKETLKEYKKYAKFLYMLSPSDWRDAQKQKRMERKAAKKKEEIKVSNKQDNKLQMPHRPENSGQTKPIFHPRSSSSVSESRPSSIRAVSVDDSDTESSESEQELELYFTDPQQLNQIIKELEDENIHLLQQLQEEEDNLEEIKQKGNITKEKMAQKLKSAKENKELLVETLAREKEVTEKLEQKLKIFSFEDYDTEAQDKMLSKMTKLIAEAYTSCVGDFQAPNDPLQMLVGIENSIIEVEEKLEAIPKERLEAIRKKKLKEMKRRIREENLKKHELDWAARLHRAMERATAEPKKMNRRKLMKRSMPSSTKIISTDADKQAIIENEELKYFFS